MPGLSETSALTLELQVSGGIAGRDERLRLTDDGRALVFDRRSERTGEITLDPVRQRKITEIVTALEKTATDEDSGRFSSSRCRDCPVYDLILHNGDKSRRIRIVSDRINESPYRELIVTLRALMTEAVGNKDSSVTH